MWVKLYSVRSLPMMIEIPTIVKLGYDIFSRIFCPASSSLTCTVPLIIIDVYWSLKLVRVHIREGHEMSLKLVFDVFMTSGSKCCS